MVWSIAGVAVVITVDYTTGRTSLAMFYVVFVVAGGALVGLGGGMTLAALCAAAWEGVDVLHLGDRAPSGVDAWNAVTRFVVLAIVAYLVSRIVDLLEVSRATERRSREFLSSAAHQLRTPTAALQSSSEALLMRPMDDASAALLANIASETRRMGRMVASLLRLARLDQEHISTPVRIDPGSLCRDEAARARSRKGVVVVVDVQDSVPRWVTADSDALRDPLANLLENAVRHARSRVDVVVGYAAQALQVNVSDDGPGVNPDAVEQIFERFVSLDGHGGSGLGLAIARDAARGAGGDLTYDGGTFRLVVPAAVASGRRLAVMPRAMDHRST